MKRTASLLALTVVMGLITTGPAEARRHRAAVPACDPLAFWEPCAATVAPKAKERTAGRRTRAAGASHRVRRTASGAGIVAHPAGCPRTAFCGCGASVRVFGASRRDLWQARAWLRFPSAAAAPGMVAASFEHVFVLESHVSGSTWIVYDANSGGHRTRIHQRSIAGYSIVNPRT